MLDVMAEWQGRQTDEEGCGLESSTQSFFCIFEEWGEGLFPLSEEFYPPCLRLCHCVAVDTQFLSVPRENMMTDYLSGK